MCMCVGVGVGVGVGVRVRVRVRAYKLFYSRTQFINVVVSFQRCS